MAHRADMARGTRADVTRHAMPHGRAALAHAECRWRTGGADTWQGPHESTQTPGWCHVAGGWRVKGHGLVGPGQSIVVVKQMRYTLLPFILTRSHFFLPCGTKFPRVLVFVGQVAASRASNAIAGRRSRGPESTQSPSGAHASKKA